MAKIRAHKALALSAGLMLLAAACGGDDSATTEPTAPPTTSAPITLEPPETLPPLSTPTTTTTTTILAPTNELLTSSDTVVTTGIGPIRIGMTLEQASEAVGAPVVGEGVVDTNCFFARVSNGPAGVTFMVWDGIITRVDITAGPITTRSGAGIGMSEQGVRDLFPGQIEESPHAYVAGGKYLTFVPRDEQDQEYRVIFETDGSVVTQYRAGLLPQVGFIEGCA